MKASRFHRNSRSQSIPVPTLLGHRGSISLPEILDGMPSGQLGNRLSLVADELEETFKVSQYSVDDHVWHWNNWA